MWVWRDDLGSGGAAGGWRLDGNTWVWEEPSPLERPGAGTGALRGYAGASAAGERRVERPERPTGDRALATLGNDPTPIFHELSVDRSRSIPRPSYRDRDAVHVPEPHPGSGPLPIQDEEWVHRGGRGLRDVPTVPPPPAPGAPEAAESPEDELRRRAERRRRPLDDAPEAAREGGRHTWRREEIRSGRHALRR